jgi:hypothetical protein
MPILYETNHAAEHILSEVEGMITRDEITVGGGAKLEAGTVLSKLITATAVATPDGGNTGDGVMGAVTVGSDAKEDVYTLTIVDGDTDAGDFTVENSQGQLIGAGVVGAAFNKGGLSFTLADGATDFAVGDLFTIAVTATSEVYEQLDPAANDGSENAVAVLYSRADAVGGNVTGVANIRDTVFKKDVLIWPTGITQADKDAAIASLAEQRLLIQ